MVLLASAVLPAGCESGMAAIDRATADLIRETSRDLGGDAMPPRTQSDTYRPGRSLVYPGTEVQEPATINPIAGELEYHRAGEQAEYDPQQEAEQVLERLRQAEEATRGEDVLVLDLEEALRVAIESGREYRDAEEDYILAALRLLVERHIWGPRFFNDVTASVDALGDDALYDSSFRIVNELGVTQRLPYGGSVSAQLLARAAEDLHLRVAGEETSSADVLLSANIPLLRGAGQAAREPRIQAERSLIYSVRSFERFRRSYLVDVAREFLDLVVRQQNIENTKQELERRLENLDRERSLAEGGREAGFRAALAENDLLDTRDQLRGQQDSYQLALDRFKVRLGLEVSTNIEIEPSELTLPAPATDISRAVERALTYRLDLQTSRDRIADARRGVDNAANEILPDLDLAGSVSIPTDSERQRAGLRFNSEDTDFFASVTFGLPLDRRIERLQLRQAQIDAERSVRDYNEFRDNVIVEVRGSLREIERAIFTLDLQQRNLEIARRRKENIDAAPSRATPLERSEAEDAITSAANALDQARRDLQVAILEYLLSTGTLRVARDGSLLPLEGMGDPMGSP